MLENFFSRNSLKQSLEEVSLSCLSPEMIEAIISAVILLLREWKDRSAKRQQRRAKVGYDPEESEHLEKEDSFEDDVLATVCLYY